MSAVTSAAISTEQQQKAARAALLERLHTAALHTQLQFLAMEVTGQSLRDDELLIVTNYIECEKIRFDFFANFIRSAAEKTDIGIKGFVVWAGFAADSWEKLGGAEGWALLGGNQ